MSNILKAENGVKIYMARGNKTVARLVAPLLASGWSFYYFEFSNPCQHEGWTSNSLPHENVYLGKVGRSGKRWLSFYDLKRRGFFKVVQQ